MKKLPHLDRRFCAHDMTSTSSYDECEEKKVDIIAARSVGIHSDSWSSSSDSSRYAKL